MGAKPVQFIGDISYSLYLWHWPIFVFMPFFIDGIGLIERLIGITVTFNLAWLTYACIENPFRFSQRLGRRVRISIAVGALLSGSSASFALVVREISASSLRTEAQQRYFQASRDTPKIYANDCHAKYFQIETPECVFGQVTSDKSIVLFGDSHAAQWFPALEKLAERHDWRLISLTKTSCSSIYFEQTYTKLGRPYKECTQWRSQAIERIKAERPTLLIIANSNRHIPTSKTLDDQQRRDQWAAAVEKTLSLLDGLPTQIVIIRDTPWLPFRAPTCLSRADWQGKDAAKHCSFSIDTLSTDPIFEAEKSTLSLSRQGHTIDMNDVICSESPCTVDRNGVVLYLDGHHLTAGYSRELADDLFTRLQPAILQAQ
jgi:hypothetical protein